MITGEEDKETVQGRRQNRRIGKMTRKDNRGRGHMKKTENME